MPRRKEERKSLRKFKTTLVGVSGSRQAHKIVQPEGGVSGRAGGEVQVHGILDKVLWGFSFMSALCTPSSSSRQSIDRISLELCWIADLYSARMHLLPFLLSSSVSWECENFLAERDFTLNHSLSTKFIYWNIFIFIEYIYMYLTRKYENTINLISKI